MRRAKRALPPRFIHAAWSDSDEDPAAAARDDFIIKALTAARQTRRVVRQKFRAGEPEEALDAWEHAPVRDVADFAVREIEAALGQIAIGGDTDVAELEDKLISLSGGAGSAGGAGGARAARAPVWKKNRRNLVEPVYDAGRQRLRVSQTPPCDISVMNGMYIKAANVVCTFKLEPDCDTLDLRALAQRTGCVSSNCPRFQGTKACIRRFFPERFSDDYTSDGAVTGLLFDSGAVVGMGARTPALALYEYLSFVQFMPAIGACTRCGYSRFRVHNLVATLYLGVPLDLNRLEEGDNIFSHSEPSSFPGTSLHMPAVTANCFTSGTVAFTGQPDKALFAREVRNFIEVIACNIAIPDAPDAVKNAATFYYIKYTQRTSPQCLRGYLDEWGRTPAGASALARWTPAT